MFTWAVWVDRAGLLCWQRTLDTGPGVQPLDTPHSPELWGSPGDTAGTASTAALLEMLQQRNALGFSAMSPHLHCERPSPTKSLPWPLIGASWVLCCESRDLETHPLNDQPLETVFNNPLVFFHQQLINLASLFYMNKEQNENTCSHRDFKDTCAQNSVTNLTVFSWFHLLYTSYIKASLIIYFWSLKSEFSML